ncbi:MAG: AarF/UbiB family protein, partial [Proteobacteria bacterium]|nr:AarF/UbiB family protein [Pseudomonadota bacterium]
MGAATVRFVVTSMVKGCFNSDPNPGNFMFTDHKAYFIDYGCVHEINRTQRVYSTLLIRSILDQDLANYKTSAHMMGFVRDAKTFDFEAAFRAFTSARMGMWAEDKVQPIDMTKLVESFINMTTFSKNVADPQVGLRPKKFSYRFPPEFFFFFREYFG